MSCPKCAWCCLMQVRRWVCEVQRVCGSALSAGISTVFQRLFPVPRSGTEPRRDQLHASIAYRQESANSQITLCKNTVLSQGMTPAPRFLPMLEPCHSTHPIITIRIPPTSSTSPTRSFSLAARSLSTVHTVESFHSHANIAAANCFRCPRCPRVGCGP